VIGATLSRWTLSYFASALAFLLLALGLLAWGYGLPAGTGPQTLVVVHIIAIGWLSLLMVGALLQFVPVLTARPLPIEWAGGAGLALIVTGLVALLTGFLALEQVELPIAALPVGAALLAMGFAFAAAPVVTNLWLSRPLSLPARFVVIGLAALAFAIAFGVAFAAGLGGVTESWWTGNIANAIPFHAALGLGGWLGLTAMGVSYRLLGMFLLSDDAGGPLARPLLAAGSGAVILVGVGGCLALAGAHSMSIALVAGLLGLVATAFYAFDAITLYRRRRRPHLELNAIATIGSLVALGGLGVLSAVLLLIDGLADHLDAVAFLAAFGWLTGLGLAQLFKIVPFLTWLEAFAPLMGRQPTPRVQDLVLEQAAAPWFAAYFAATGFAALMLLAGEMGPFRAFVAVQLVAVGAIVLHLIRARRLSYVPAEQRLGVMNRPVLFPRSKTRAKR
jgi:hypothetical protein